jgi:ribulose kinase
MKRLFLLSGAMQLDYHIEILPGLVLAENEQEAMGIHFDWMKRTFPNMLVHSLKAAQVADDMIREATAGIEYRLKLN